MCTYCLWITPHACFKTDQQLSKVNALLWEKNIYIMEAPLAKHFINYHPPISINGINVSRIDQK